MARCTDPNEALEDEEFVAVVSQLERCGLDPSSNVRANNPRASYLISLSNLLRSRLVAPSQLRLQRTLETINPSLSPTVSPLFFPSTLLQKVS